MDSVTHASFGDLLRNFRKRRKLRQQELAEMLGIHRNTIGTWERGDYLPDSKGIVLELARLLALDEQETRQLLEASLTALSPHWLVPLPRNPVFTGREEILTALHTYLGTDQAQIVALTQSYALHGLGGIGKTQIALEYAYRYSLEYSALFWIEAETSESIISSVLRIAELLHLPEREEADQQRITAAVQRWLSSHRQWLLIWDNLEDLELLQRWLPLTRQGAILLTTRHQALGTLAQGIELGPMEREDGLLFVLRRAKVLGPETTGEHLQQIAARMPAEYTAAEALVITMGGLPLALDQAGAYIEETGCSVSAYLQHYEQRSTRLLDRRGAPGGDHPHSVTTTFLLASERVEQEQRAAVDLLRVCAFLHAEAIPEEIFAAGVGHLGPEIESLTTDPPQFDLAIAVLRNLSLVQRHAETRTLSIHRLVQAVLREQMSAQEQLVWLRRVIIALNAAFPKVTYEVWEQCERLLSHVLTCAAAIPDEAGNQELVKVLLKAADYLRERTQYEQTEVLYQRALRIGEQILGAEHPDVAHALGGLALLDYEQGRYEQAEALYLQTLHIQEQALGPEHPDVAHSLNGLARLHYEQGRYEQAEALYLQALHIQEQALGLEHPELARSLDGLAILYWKQGKYEQAEALYLRELRIREQAQGPEHPSLIASLNNLALLYWKLGKGEQAEALYQRALRIQEQASGLEHPAIVNLLNNLALLYSEQEKYKQAEPLYLQATHICEKIWGPDHSNLAYPLTNLAILYMGIGETEQVEALLQRALSIWEHVGGPDHPNLVYPLTNLADLYAQQEKDEQAETCYRRALHLWEQVGEPCHPDMAFSLSGLATLYLKQGKDEQARQMFQRTLQIREQYLGPNHPETAQTLYDLATCHQKQNNPHEAIALAERALQIRSQSLGDAHSKTVASRALYAQLTQNQGFPSNKEESNTHQARKG